MKKITFFISGFLLLFLGTALFSFSLQANEKKSCGIEAFSVLDKNIIRGNWQREDAAVELQVSKLLKNGGLEVTYTNAKSVFVEKAGWTNSSEVLRLFLIYNQDGKSGYSLSLNYDEKNDWLIGVCTEGSNNNSYNVIFKRIR